MSTYETLMEKLDDLEASIVRARFRAFWMGWASGTIGAIIGSWIW